MNALATLPSATDRFASVLDALCRAVAARIAARTMPPALIVLIWGKISRIKVRVQALVAQIRSGTLRRSPVPHRRATRRTPSPRAPSPLPRRSGWLLQLVPYEAAGYASQLRCVLQDPEMAALIAATPRMVRALRPLCWMLGLEAGLLAPVHCGTVATESDPPPQGSAARPLPAPSSFPEIENPPEAADVAGRTEARPLVPT